MLALVLTAIHYIYYTKLTVANAYNIDTKTFAGNYSKPLWEAVCHFRRYNNP